MALLSAFFMLAFAIFCIALPIKLIPSDVGGPCGGRPATHRCMSGLLCTPNNTCVALTDPFPEPTPQGIPSTLLIPVTAPPFNPRPKYTNRPKP
ncbi:hypothetical protein BDF19DRAFT_442888 [Syncephalis fuscata]|nr:hypothetical protein BDF19DRAFT_442888 [Syncephalis fuscata]